MVLKRKFRGHSRKVSPARDFKKQSGSHSLTDAVKDGDTKGLKRLLGRSDTNLEETNDRGETALILAAIMGDIDALRLLVENGAAVNAKSMLSTSALMAAAQNGDLEALRYLLSKGADPNAKKKDDMTILMIAAMFGRADCIEALLEAGACVTAQDIYGYTALMLADGCENCERLLAAAETHAREMQAEKSAENGADGTLKKALSTASKKHRKHHRRAPKHERPPQEKPSSGLTKPPA